MAHHGIVLRYLHVETKDDDTDKGRSFGGYLLALAQANWFWELGTREVCRPVMLSIATTPGEARPLLENLRGGRRLRIPHEKSFRLEIPKSAGFAFEMQRAGDYVVVQAYLPELFTFDGGLVDTSTVQVVVMPSHADMDAVLATMDVAAIVEHLRALEMTEQAQAVQKTPRAAALASMLTSYVAQRTDLPIPTDPRFAAQVYYACNGSRSGYQRSFSLIHEPSQYWHWSSGDAFSAYVAPGVAQSPGAAFCASRETLEAVLSEELTKYDAAIRGDGRGQKRRNAWRSGLDAARGYPTTRA